MRIVVVRSGHEAADISAGKELVDAEITHPAKTVAFVLGDSAAVGQLADRVGTRSDGMPWRELVWLKVSGPTAKKILGDVRYNDWFPNTRVRAVILDFEDNVTARLPSDATFAAIEKAFLSG